jgi:hypothetical protein
MPCLFFDIGGIVGSGTSINEMGIAWANAGISIGSVFSYRVIDMVLGNFSSFSVKQK